jgi:8-oxo-dGTP diphosphatase
VVHEGRVLLVQRGHEPAKGQWSLPGGLIDVGESLREAVIREVREETGLIVESVELIELLERIHREDQRVRYHYVIADYLCHMVGGTLLAASDADAVRWVERAEWNSHSFHPSDEDLSPGTPDSALGIDPITTRVIEVGWQRAKVLQSQAGEKR